MSRIKSVEISDSKFYEKSLSIQLSNKLNCIMGGRGTGKTTLLSIIYSALNPNYEESRAVYGLLSSNLGQGRIKLTVEDLNGETFQIEKVLGENPVVHTSDGQLADFNEFAQNFSIDFYGASQIEEIGNSPEDRLRLIDKHLVKKINEERKKEALLATQLLQSKSKLTGLVSKIHDIKVRLEPLVDTEEELKEHERNKPEGAEIEEQAKQFEKENANQSLREFETQYVEKVATSLKNLEFQLQVNIDELENSLSQIANFTSALNSNEIEDLKKVVCPDLEEAKATLVEKRRKISNLRDAVSDKSDSINQIHKKQDLTFTQLKQTFEKNREYFQRYNQLTKKMTAKKVLSEDLKTTQGELDLAVNQREKLLKELEEIYGRIFQIRLEKIEQINEELKGDIKITLKQGGMSEEYLKELKSALKGKGFNYTDACAAIEQNVKPTELSIFVLRNDARNLAVKANIGRDKAEKIIESLLETQKGFAIEGIYCPDLPTFYLKIEREEVDSTDRESYRATEHLSTGQRCTAILPIIFAASKNPLIIDQPEDNLDNKYIADSIHKIIKSKKNFRQMIFVTHNPNIPVLSDSEFNLFLDYSGKRAKIGISGTIEEVKSSILNLLEGGEEAFDKRREIYGR